MLNGRHLVNEIFLKPVSFENRSGHNRDLRLEFKQIEPTKSTEEDCKAIEHLLCIIQRNHVELDTHCLGQVLKRTIVTFCILIYFIVKK